MASKLSKIIKPSYIFRAINNINNTNGTRRATWLTPIAALHSSSECTSSMFQGSGGKLCRQTTHLYGNLTLLQNTRGLSSYAGGQKEQFNEEGHKKDIIGSEDTFNPLTDKIPEKPVTFVEGASYSVVILAALGIAGAVAYAVITELLIEPIEYKVFGKALARVQQDNQIKARIGSPITGYGQESRNRAARQRFPYRKWTDEEGIERVEVQFHIRGPSGSGVTTSEMFKDKKDKTWKYTYLIVDITSPTKTRMILESYIPS